MDNTLLTGIVVILSIQTAIIAVFLCKIAEIYKQILTFITPADEKTPSPAAAVWTSMAKALVQEIKLVFMGLNSVQSRAEKRLEGELVEQAVAAKSPLAAAALNAVPALKKMFIKNPALVEYAIGKITQAGPAPGNGASHDEPFATRMSRYG